MPNNLRVKNLCVTGIHVDYTWPWCSALVLLLEGHNFITDSHPRDGFVSLAKQNPFPEKPNDFIGFGLINLNTTETVTK